MLSDNGKIFKADQLRAFNTRNVIIWRFKSAKAPWWGSLSKWFICSTKRCLRNCVRNAAFAYEQFRTNLIEIEGVLNNRPLTYPGKDDIEESRTANHLYCGHRILNPINREEGLSIKLQLKQVLQSFWKHWRKDSLLELRPIHVGNKTKESNIKVNGIITILDKHRKRNKW